MKVFLTLLFLAAIFMTAIPVSAQTCYANGDVNNLNDTTYGGGYLTVADIVYLQRFLLGEVDSLGVPYNADLNGDCVIDMLDYDVYTDWTVSGLSAFTPYGGYPVLTCCNVQQYCCTGMKGNIDNDPNDLINILDVVYMTNYLYKDGPIPICLMEVDVNDDGSRNLLDAVYIIDYLYKGGAAPDSCQ